METIALLLLLSLAIVFIVWIAVSKYKHNKHIHNFTQWAATEDKETQSRVCLDCNFFEQSIIPPINCSKGHTYGKWNQNFPGSSFQYRKCIVCNYLQEVFV